VLFSGRSFVGISQVISCQEIGWELSLK